MTTMPQYVIIDGNNLLHAMHAHAPIPTVGRETMVKVIERWARRGQDNVTLVFDGPVPRDGLAKQMTSNRIDVHFSAPRSADDLIVDRINRTKEPTGLRVISSDTAIRREARHRRCRHTDSVAFIAELFATTTKPARDSSPSSIQEDKPAPPTSEQTDAWLEEFGFGRNGDDEPFDGHDAMAD